MPGGQRPRIFARARAQDGRGAAPGQNPGAPRAEGPTNTPPSTRARQGNARAAKDEAPTRHEARRGGGENETGPSPKGPRAAA